MNFLHERPGYHSPMTYIGAGASPTVINKFNSGIEDAWSGPFGQYDVRTKVVEGYENTIYVPSITTERSFVYSDNDCSGAWDPVEEGWVAAHEAGHLMGLPDFYRDINGKSVPMPGHDKTIMGQYGGDITEDDITMILFYNALSSTSSYPKIDPPF